MSKIDDDSVESFFRNADENRFHSEYNEDDWKKMEQRLKQEELRLAALKERRLKYGAIGGVALLLVVSVFVYLFFTGNETGTDNTVIERSPSQQQLAPVPRDDADNTLTDADKLTDGEESSNALSSSQNEIDADSENRTAISKERNGEVVENKTAGSDVVSERMTSQQKIFNSQATSRPKESVKTQEEDADISIRREDVPESSDGNGGMVSSGKADNKYDLKPGEMLKEETKSVENELSGEREMAASPGKHGDKPEVSAISRDSVVVHQGDSAALMTESVRDSDSGKQDNKNPISGRWMISLSAAPDFSRTANSDYDNPVGAYGLHFHYFMKRWGISTGIVRVNKHYWGYGNEYNPPAGYWKNITNGMVPEKVEGNCLVLEIPLSLSYNIVEARRSRIFVTAGVSSYFMRSEKYSYTFDQPNPGAPTGWSTGQPSSYWFGIGNLSVGYDYQISPIFSLGIEPYYKIPFSGVGWANIDLYSTGMLVNARFKFLKKEYQQPDLK